MKELLEKGSDQYLLRERLAFHVGLATRQRPSLLGFSSLIGLGWSALLRLLHARPGLTKATLFAGSSNPKRAESSLPNGME